VVKVGAESVVGNEQVGPAVVVVVSGAHGKVFALGLVDFGFDSDVGESPVSVVVVKRVSAAAIDAGWAAALHSPEIAVPAVSQIDIAADVQIEPSIAIIVKEGRT